MPKKVLKKLHLLHLKVTLNSAVPAVPANATDAERYKMIIDPDVSRRRGHITSIAVFDDQGKQHTLKTFLWKSDTNKWTASVSVADASQLSVDVLSPGGQNTTVPGNTRFELGFSADGKLISVSDGTDTSNQGDLSADISFRVPGNPDVSNIQLRLGEAGKINGITQFAAEFSTKINSQDGKPMGYMESFEIDNSGLITGIYSNGAKQPLGQIAMANFTNPEGLTKTGQNNYQVSNNSGDALIGESGYRRIGKY